MSDGKTIDKGFVITPAMSLFLAGVFISVLAYGYKSAQSDSRETRDAVIRMETMLNERTTTFKERQAEMQTKLDNEIKLAEIRRERETDKNSKLMAALRQKGVIVDE